MISRPYGRDDRYCQLPGMMFGIWTMTNFHDCGPIGYWYQNFDPFQVDIPQSPKTPGGAELCPEGDSIAVTADNAPWAMWCGRISAENCDSFLGRPVTRCFFVNSVVSCTVVPTSRTILEISGLLHAFTAHQFMILIVCSSLLATQMLLCPFDHAGKFLPHPNPKIQKGLAG